METCTQTIQIHSLLHTETAHLHWLTKVAKSYLPFARVLLTAHVEALSAACGHSHGELGIPSRLASSSAG